MYGSGVKATTHLEYRIELFATPHTREISKLQPILHAQHIRYLTARSSTQSTILIGNLQSQWPRETRRPPAPARPHLRAAAPSTTSSPANTPSTSTSEYVEYIIISFVKSRNGFVISIGRKTDSAILIGARRELQEASPTRDQGDQGVCLQADGMIFSPIMR